MQKAHARRRPPDARIARRALWDLDVAALLDDCEGWRHEVEPTASGFPSITMYSPYLDISERRRLIAQVEPPGRSADGASYQASVGIEVWIDEFTEGQSDPEWIPYVRALGEHLEAELAGSLAEVTAHQGRGRAGEPGGVEKDQAVEAGLPLRYARATSRTVEAIWA